MSEQRPAHKSAKAAPTSVRRPVSTPKQRKRQEGNPSWYAPVMLGLMLVGLMWVVVYYMTMGRYPVASWGQWNLGAGAGLMLAGFLMTMNWK